MTEEERSVVEAIVGSGMGVSEWCEANGVAVVRAYRLLRCFRDNEPGVFGGYEAAHAGGGHRRWYEHVRRAMGCVTAAGSFAVVDVATLAAGPATARAGIVVEVGSVRVTVCPVFLSPA